MMTGVFLCAPPPLLPRMSPPTPQQRTVPSAINAQALYPPTEMPDADAIPTAETAVALKATVPSPNWPYEFAPQHRSAPPAMITQLCRPPAATAGVAVVMPVTNTLVEDSFKLFMNYDGAGAKVAGDSVRATSTCQFQWCTWRSC